MKSSQHISSSDRFKLFHDLMAWKVKRILLISTPYEAWVMEEDCRLSEQIVNEYRGLSLSQPPRLTWASSAEEAIEKLREKEFDLVIAISSSFDFESFHLGSEIKKINPNMPVVLLTHQEVIPEVRSIAGHRATSIDHIFFWSGQADILLAIIKCIEDRHNTTNDILYADVRVILFVEDSPFYLSSILPTLYKELVIETQAVIDESLNQEHRLLIMRSRPKILIAHSFEDALELYEKYKANILGVISDVRYPRNDKVDERAGVDLLHLIKKDRFDVPLLLTSSEPHNAALAGEIPATFLDKNTSQLHDELKSFFFTYLGFDYFYFKTPTGEVLTSAVDLYDLELKISEIQLDSFLYHCRTNDFSRWLFCLAEFELAAEVRSLRETQFESSEKRRGHLRSMIRDHRKERQKGVLVNFDKKKFDPGIEFMKIGNGSLGGKARGLAFLSAMLYQHPELVSEFDTVEIGVPCTLVLTTECFDAFIKHNMLGDLLKADLPDVVVADFFSNCEFPEPFATDLSVFLQNVTCPLAVRSSSLLEDAKFKSYAGLYHTYIVANDHDEFHCRLNQLLQAVKMVYASTFYQAPKSFSKRVGNKIENEKMAVVIQQVTGHQYGEHFYPAVSGVVQSLNYYPYHPATTDDGIANIALGLGKMVMEGGDTLRFSPKYPAVLPQRSSVDDILKNAQRKFYSLKMRDERCCKAINDTTTLVKRTTRKAATEYPLGLLSSTYNPEEHRIRDTYSSKGLQVITFASILKHGAIPLAKILSTMIEFGREKLGCAVEIEFALDFKENSTEKAEFSLLQIRPMSAREEMFEVDITEVDRADAFLVSENGLGNTVNKVMYDLVYVKPGTFDPSKTKQIAEEIRSINQDLMGNDRRYLLVGPGRWGSSDHWLGIPVGWPDISSVGAIVEAHHEKLNAEPSQGSHFFHNLTTMGISYVNILKGSNDFVRWEQLESASSFHETEYVVHLRLDQPLTLKIDGRSQLTVITCDF